MPSNPLIRGTLRPGQIPILPLRLPSHLPAQILLLLHHLLQRLPHLHQDLHAPALPTSLPDNALPHHRNHQSGRHPHPGPVDDPELRAVLRPRRGFLEPAQFESLLAQDARVVSQRCVADCYGSVDCRLAHAHVGCVAFAPEAEDCGRGGLWVGYFVRLSLDVSLGYCMQFINANLSWFTVSA